MTFKITIKTDLNGDLTDNKKREQTELREQLILRDDIGDINSIRFIGGVDISFPKDDDDHACPGFVVLSFPENGKPKVVYEDFSLEHLSVPYIPNFLAFREVPLLKEKIDKLKREDPEKMPQVIMVDGNGVHHKRGFGIASHLGVLTGLPTIGVAKNLLHIDDITDTNAHKIQIRNELNNKGDKFPLEGPSGENTAMLAATTIVARTKRCGSFTDWVLLIPMTLRTSKPHGDSACKPIYVSVGHRIGLETAVDLVLRYCEYRIPEPTRQADILSRKFLREKYATELAKCPCKNK